MTDTSHIDGTADELPVVPDSDEGPGGELVPLMAGAGAIIRAEQPEQIIEKATTIANALKSLIDGQGLAASMGGGRKHVEVGAWQACGTMLGALGGQPLHAETVWTRRVVGEDGQLQRTRYTATVKRYHRKDQGGGLREETTYEVDGFDWEACVEIRTPGGVVVGRAEAMCSRQEETWNRRDDYAVRSMAETRAESRAYRRAIGWIVHLAGYSPTPAEEMGHVPGTPMDQGPAFGAPVAAEKKAMVLAAIEELVKLDQEPVAAADIQPTREAAKTVATAIAGMTKTSEDADAYMPAIVGQAIMALANAHVARQTAALEAQAKDAASTTEPVES